ncbi:MAG: glycine/betaine ABC transporter permease, partial [Proteobacteria bacterium]|nr:glycine/betaine ABC transporter permease [Pseudomonadota bacterium]
MNSRHQRKERFSLFAWVAVAIFGSVFLFQRDLADWVTQYPEAWTLPAATWANVGMDWFVDHFRWLFRAISWLLTWPMDAILGLLTWLPWPTTISLFIGIAFVAGGWPLALFTLFALLYMVGIGYWTESMRTLALVAV